MFCDYCGSSLPDNVTTCPYCCAKIETIVPPMKPKKKKTGLIIIIVILIILIVLAAAGTALHFLFPDIVKKITHKPSSIEKVETEIETETELQTQKPSDTFDENEVRTLATKFLLNIQDENYSSVSNAFLPAILTMAEEDLGMTSEEFAQYFAFNLKRDNNIQPAFEILSVEESDGSTYTDYREESLKQYDSFIECSKYINVSYQIISGDNIDSAYLLYGYANGKYFIVDFSSPVDHDTENLSDYLNGEDWIMNSTSTKGTFFTPVSGLYSLYIPEDWITEEDDTLDLTCISKDSTCSLVVYPIEWNFTSDEAGVEDLYNQYTKLEVNDLVIGHLEINGNKGFYVSYSYALSDTMSFPQVAFILPQDDIANYFIVTIIDPSSDEVQKVYDSIATYQSL